MGSGLLQSELAGGAIGGGETSMADIDGWAMVTGEVYWNLMATRATRRFDASPQVAIDLDNNLVQLLYSASSCSSTDSCYAHQ